MNNEEKITQESKEFIKLVMKMYAEMGQETQLNITIGNKRTCNYTGNQEINISVLNQAEADKLNEMKNKIDELNAKSKEDKNEKNSNEPENVEEDPLEAWKSFYKNNDKETRDELLEEYANYYEYEKRKTVPQKNHKKKRDLRKTLKKLVNKAYKLSKQTKEKAIKAKKKLEKNGKKAIGLTAALALISGIAAHEVYSDVKGYQTYKEYGSTEKIELSVNETIANEFRKAVDNPNLEITTKEITEKEDLTRTYKIIITDPNNPDFEMSFDVGAFEWSNPSYITQIVKKYEQIKNINKHHNGITETISAAKAGRALNYVENKAKKNDVIIKEGITGKLNIDRVQERIVNEETKTEIER